MPAPFLQLNDGHTLPTLGLGTYRVREADTLLCAVKAAAEAGYGLIDSASVYRNEEAVGRAVRAAAPLTQDAPLFITTKLAPKDQGYDACTAAVETSLGLLGIARIDLVLIHWPGVAKTQLDDAKNEVLRHESYRALIDLRSRGLVRSIGVSNYTLRHLQTLAHAFPNHPPGVLQTELHPLYQDVDVVAWCKERGIAVQAYSSLGEGALLDEAILPGLRERAARLGATPAQVLLAWALHQGWAIIPKSVHPTRVLENAKALDLSLNDETVEWLNASEEREGTRKFCWDPRDVA